MKNLIIIAVIAAIIIFIVLRVANKKPINQMSLEDRINMLPELKDEDFGVKTPSFDEMVLSEVRYSILEEQGKETNSVFKEYNKYGIWNYNDFIKYKNAMVKEMKTRGIDI